MRAASIRFLEGKHPRLAQVPPTVRSSVMATVLPSSAACRAAAKAVEPLPRITRSKRSGVDIEIISLQQADPPGARTARGQIRVHPQGSKWDRLALPHVFDVSGQTRKRYPRSALRRSR